MTPWIGERADAVIFDHDGTLVDSETITLSLLATMAVEAGAELYPDDATRFMGSDISVVIDEIEVRSGTTCLLYTSPSPRDATLSRMPSSA